ncbi:MAG: SDR family oxidoreductase [Pseudomonadales bacterium]|nr:SDR family oxidoreductase [Pseudomonadales bacterium]
MKPLAGQHAFVTGGGSGIGLACARAFVQDGARVTVMGRNRGKLEAAVASLGEHGDARLFAGDVGDEESVREAIETANAWAPLTIAVANAGTGGLGTVVRTTAEQWRAVMQTNLDGTFYTFRHAAKAIAANGGGALCAISSIAGLRTHRFMSTYCVSKAGIDMLVRNLADEMGCVGVRVNSVCPGLVDTEIAAGLFATDDVHEDYLSCMPLARTGVVDDIGRAVRFLCGPESSWITGVNLPVDGGHHLRRGPNLDTFARAVHGTSLFED